LGECNLILCRPG